jgi:hypothetical protein
VTTVASVAIRDARAVVEALADPQTLYVFGVIAARASTLRVGAVQRYCQRSPESP